MSEVQWFYSERGQRKGPLDDTSMENLVRDHVLTQETLVWRKGLADWVPLRSTAFSQILSDSPPPLKSQKVMSIWAWLIAILPWAVMAAFAAFDSYRNENTVLIGCVFVATALVVLDVNAIRAAGHRKPGYWWACLPLILHPVYLFVRSRALGADKAPALISCASVSSMILLLWMQTH